MNTFAKNIEIRGNVSSGMDRISDMPRCRVWSTAGQTFTTGTVTAIIFDLAVPQIDTDGFYDGNLSRTQIVIRTAGFYDIKANIAWTASGAGNTRTAWLHKNGSAATRYAQDYRPQDGTSTTYNNIAYSMALNAGDYLELIGFQGSAGNLSTTSDAGLHPTAEILLCLIST